MRSLIMRALLLPPWPLSKYSHIPGTHTLCIITSMDFIPLRSTFLDCVFDLLAISLRLKRRGNWVTVIEFSMGLMGKNTCRAIISCLLVNSFKVEPVPQSLFHLANCLWLFAASTNSLLQATLFHPNTYFCFVERHQSLQIFHVYLMDSHLLL